MIDQGAYKKTMKKTYYVHALLGFRKESATRRGPYKYFFIARQVAIWLVAYHPYGEAVITESADAPKIID